VIGVNQLVSAAIGYATDRLSLDSSDWSTDELDGGTR